MEVVFSDGQQLTIGEFLAELSRFRMVLEGLGKSDPDVMTYFLLANDLLNLVNRPQDERITRFAQDREFVDESGNYTQRVLVFAENMLDRSDPDNFGLRAPGDVIANWNDVKPLLRQMRDSLPEVGYEPPVEVVELSTAYAFGHVGMLALLGEMAGQMKWKTAQQVVEWVGYPLGQASYERAAEFYRNKKKKSDS
jgi:hypothetical protein